MKFSAKLRVFHTHVILLCPPSKILSPSPLILFPLSYTFPYSFFLSTNWVNSSRQLLENEIPNQTHWLNYKLPGAIDKDSRGLPLKGANSLRLKSVVNIMAVNIYLQLLTWRMIVFSKSFFGNLISLQKWNQITTVKYMLGKASDVWACTVFKKIVFNLLICSLRTAVLWNLHVRARLISFLV